MTPVQLQQALERMPSRAAQTLIFRCVEGRSPAECAALYGIGVPQWEVLFFDATRALVQDATPLDAATRRAHAAQLQAELTSAIALPSPLSLTTAVSALTRHAEEVQRLRAEAEKAAAASPARARETLLRRVAVAAIVAVSLFVWMRERNKPPTPTPSHFPLPPQKVG